MRRVRAEEDLEQVLHGVPPWEIAYLPKTNGVARIDRVVARSQTGEPSGALDQLDPVAVRIAHEAEARTPSLTV